MLEDEEYNDEEEIVPVDQSEDDDWETEYDQQEADFFKDNDKDESQNFINALFSGEIDNIAGGEHAREIFENYGTTDIKKANYITGNIAKQISARESVGNNPYAALPKRKDGSLASSAVGKYQFLWNTHKDWIEQQTGVHSKEEFRNSPEAQEQAFDYWDKTTLTPQARKYLPELPNYSEDQVKMMIHFGGEGNLRKAIKDNNFDKPLDSFGSSLNSYVNKKEFGGDVDPQPKPKLTYDQWKSKLPANLRNTDTTQYNLRGAYEGGLQPEMNEDGYYHLGSRNPNTGEILKLPTHPTWNKMLQGEKEAGYELYQKNGKYFSKPIKKAYGGPIVTKPNSTSNLKSITAPKNIKKESSVYDDYIAPVVQRVASTFNMNILNKSNDNYSDNLENVAPSINGSFQEGKRILGGDFVEESKDNIYKQKEWLARPKNSTIGDKKIPLSNIKNFYGIEDGQFKAGPLVDFKSDTDIVPIRSKNTSVYSAANEKTEGFFGMNDNLTMRDSLGNKMSENIGRNGKLILYSPVTKKKVFLNGETDYKAAEINKFVKTNPQSKYIMLDNGRFYTHLTNEEGLTDNDFKAYNSATFKGNEQKTYNIVSKKKYGGQLKYKV